MSHYVMTDQEKIRLLRDRMHDLLEDLPFESNEEVCERCYENDPDWEADGPCIHVLARRAIAETSPKKRPRTT